VGVLTGQGLSSEEAKRRLAAEGPNTLPDAGRRGTLGIALEVVREPMFLLLVAGALIYLLLGDVREAAVLAVSIGVVMAITVVQERKSERALEALRDLSSPRALVVRDGAPLRIAGADGPVEWVEPDDHEPVVYRSEPHVNWLSRLRLNVLSMFVAEELL